MSSGPAGSWSEPQRPGSGAVTLAEVYADLLCVELGQRVAGLRDNAAHGGAAVSGQGEGGANRGRDGQGRGELKDVAAGVELLDDDLARGRAQLVAALDDLRGNVEGDV